MKYVIGARHTYGELFIMLDNGKHKSKLARYYIF